MIEGELGRVRRSREVVGKLGRREEKAALGAKD